MNPNKQKTHAKLDMVGPYMYTEDWQLSATGQNSASIVQRGNYTLTNGNAFVTFPRPYISANGNPNNIAFMVTSRTSTHQYVESYPVASAFGVTNLSTISGFTVSGSGSDTGFWLAIGYK